MIKPKRTTQRSVMQQQNVSHNTVGIADSRYAMPGSDIGVSSFKCTASHCQNMSMVEEVLNIWKTKERIEKVNSTLLTHI